MATKPQDLTEFSQTTVIFSYCHNLCIIDTGARRSPNIGHKDKPAHNSSLKSESFHFGDSLPCEILELDFYAESEVLAQTNPWPQVYNLLKSKPIDLPLKLNDELALAKLNQIYEGSRHVGDAKDHLDLQFTVTQLELHNKNWFQKSRMTKTDSQSGSATITVNFDGLGLVEWGPLVWRLPLSLDSWWVAAEDSSARLVESSEATQIDECKLACLMDLKCRSYSICMQKGADYSSSRLSSNKVDCLLSSVDLRSYKLRANLKSWLAIKLSTKTKENDTISLDYRDDDNEEQKVHFKVNRRCQTRAKHALQMFRRSSSRTDFVQGYLDGLEGSDKLKGVADLEECAELCLGNNRKYLEDAEFPRKVKPSGGQNSSTTESGNSGQSLAEKDSDGRERTTDSWCSMFIFFDAQRLESAPPKLVGKLNSLGAELGGLCAYGSEATMGSPNIAREPNEGPNEHQLPREPFDTYELVYSSLYRRQPNVRLKLPESGPPTSNSLRQAYAYVQEPERCARVCFLQEVEFVRNFHTDNGAAGEAEVESGDVYGDVLCKSFDFIQTKSIANPAQTINYCIFNSLSLIEAKEIDKKSAGNSEKLVDYEPHGLASYWHFEPHESIQMDPHLRPNWRKVDEQRSPKRYKSASSRRSKVKMIFLRTFSLLIIFLLGLASGYLVTPRSLDSLKEGPLHAIVQRLGLSGGSADPTFRRSANGWPNELDETSGADEMSLGTRGTQLIEVSLIGQDQLGLSQGREDSMGPL